MPCFILPPACRDMVRHARSRCLMVLHFNIALRMLMKMSLRDLISVALGVLLATSAHSALVVRDLVVGSGDSLVTFDTTTGLEWLDTAITDGRSFKEIQAGWGGWTTAAGFRYATIAEVRELISSAGLVPNSSYDTYTDQSDAIYFKRAVALTLLLGPTFIYEDEGSPYRRRSVIGFVADNYSSSSADENYGRYADIGYYELGWTSRAWAFDGSSTQAYRDSQSGELGSFLVREVSRDIPEPTGLALIALGLASLITVRKVMT